MSENVDANETTPSKTNGLDEPAKETSKTAEAAENTPEVVSEKVEAESAENIEGPSNAVPTRVEKTEKSDVNLVVTADEVTSSEETALSEKQPSNSDEQVVEDTGKRDKEDSQVSKPPKVEVKDDEVEESSEEPLDSNVNAAEEDADKPNTLNDDLIFVKPKDKDRGHCYCGKDRNLNIVELLCANCNRWFHESCIGYQLGKLVPFMTNYVFLCKNCSPSGLEIFKKNQSTIAQLCVTAIGNLTQASIKEGKPKRFFSKDKDIIPFIEGHWEGMTPSARRVTQSWHATVFRTLLKETGAYFATNKNNDDTTFGLFNPDITQVKPNYEAMLKGGHLKMTEMGVQPVGGTGVKGRGGAKRKAPGEGPNAGIGKRNRIESAPVKLSAHGYPLEHPFNKDGFRYFLAEPDPHAPFRQEFDESSELAGKPIPGWLYRSLCPNSVLIALHDRAPQLRVSEDRLSVIGEKGYCMARATHYVSRGMWYYEVNVDEMRDGSACRIGWGQAFANLQTPLGFDKFGYCWRSRKGTRFHEARGKHYSSGYGEGDTLGLLIFLPEAKNTPRIPTTLKDRPLVKFKSHLYYEEKDYLAEKTKTLTPLGGSKIVFFKNGKCLGEAFINLYDGQYYPTVSLYKTCVLSLNFGPDFKHAPPKEEYPYRAMYERAEETICEQTLSDLTYLTENEGKLKLDL